MYIYIYVYVYVYIYGHHIYIHTSKPVKNIYIYIRICLGPARVKCQGMRLICAVSYS